MPWAQRDESGAITGLYGAKQPGFAEEELADDDAEVTAFNAAQALAPTVATSADLEALTAALITKGIITPADIDTERATIDAAVEAVKVASEEKPVVKPKAQRKR